jgi:DNA-binding transcriptional regulator of glucitol operon
MCSVPRRAVKRGSGGGGREHGALTVRDVAQLLRQPEDEREQAEIEAGFAVQSSPATATAAGGAEAEEEAGQQNQQETAGPRRRAAAAAEARAAAAAAAAMTEC